MEVHVLRSINSSHVASPDHPPIRVFCLSFVFLVHLCWKVIHA